MCPYRSHLRSGNLRLIRQRFVLIKGFKNGTQYGLVLRAAATQEIVQCTLRANQFSVRGRQQASLAGRANRRSVDAAWASNCTEAKAFGHVRRPQQRSQSFALYSAEPPAERERPVFRAKPGKRGR